MDNLSTTPEPHRINVTANQHCSTKKRVAVAPCGQDFTSVLFEMTPDFEMLMLSKS